jgi:uncharacterized protein YjbI with pentapeptide repeats
MMNSRTIPKLDDTSYTRKQVQIAIRQKKSLAGSDLRGLDLSELNFDGADLAGCKLAEANLSNCSFQGAVLDQASLWRANLSHSNLNGASLVGTDLEWCNLDSCTIHQANIQRTILPLQFLSGKEIYDAVQSGSPIHLRKISAKQ